MEAFALKNLKQAANVGEKSWKGEILFPLLLFVFAIVIGIVVYHVFSFIDKKYEQE